MGNFESSKILFLFEGKLKHACKAVSILVWFTSEVCKTNWMGVARCSSWGKKSLLIGHEVSDFRVGFDLFRWCELLAKP